MRQITPCIGDTVMDAKPLVNLISCHIMCAVTPLPEQGGRSPWRIQQNYRADFVVPPIGRIEDGPELRNPDRRIQK